MRSLILHVVIRVAVPLSFFLGLYLFFRGHHEPGGGFIAGVIIAIAFSLSVLASGWKAIPSWLYSHSEKMIAWGLTLSFLTGAISIFFGFPFFTSAVRYSLPLFGKVELPTSIFFDTGVCLVVIGTLLTLFRLLSREE